MDQRRARVPDDAGVIPSDGEPDPAPEAEVESTERLEGVDRGGTGEPVGADNIREGRVRGTMVPSSSSEGEGQGG
jgi:hypothetical protein